MKVLHQLGHKHNWNLEIYYENGIGDGFIFGAYNIERNKFFDDTLSGYKLDDILYRSFIDLQYYGKTKSKGLGKFTTYDFHPANQSSKDNTIVYADSSIRKGIKFEESLGLKNIIIPNFCFDLNSDYKNQILMSNRLLTKKANNCKYFLSIPLSKEIVKDETKLDIILNHLTDTEISFDGYYVVAEPILEYKQKINIDYRYLENLTKFLSILKKQKFEIIYGYANIDAILYAALNVVDYVTIGTYENLRNFNIHRYTQMDFGGPSKGWYYSEKLLNFVKAQELDKIRINNSIPIIKNDSNVFSDVILNEGFSWNTHKPDIHKNYLVSIYNLLKQIDSFNSTESRIKFLINLISQAMENYRLLNENKVYLMNESGDYHLDTWLTFLKGKL